MKMMIKIKIQQKKTRHEVSGFTFTTISSFHPTNTVSHSGPDSGDIFLTSILEEKVRVLKLKDEATKPMDELTPVEIKTHSEATVCFICEEPYIMKYSDDAVEQESHRGFKVRDHCHYTGKYRGAAHSGCNAQYALKKKIPVIFHNLGGYDGHIIFQNLTEIQDIAAPQVVAKTLEKFISFKIGAVEIIDSMNFLSSSLDKLVDTLKIKATKGNNLKQAFKHTYEYQQKYWNHIPEEEAMALLTQKGVYPYSYMDSFAKFEEQQLPPMSAYYDDLTLSHISDEKYTRAQKVWETFGLKNLGQLHDLYMETDVMLLADVFENFRTFSLKNYKLDPTHFVTAPSLSWSAALKHTKVELELMTDPEMCTFVDKGLVGGISLIGNQYAKANNPDLGEANYDPSKPNSYIMLLDCNNQVKYKMI